jgi:hypothetical protein
VAFGIVRDAAGVPIPGVRFSAAGLNNECNPLSAVPLQTRSPGGGDPDPSGADGSYEILVYGPALCTRIVAHSPAGDSVLTPRHLGYGSERLRPPETRVDIVFP